MRIPISLLVICLSGLFVLAGCNSTERKLAAVKDAAPPPSDGIRRITVPELKTLVDANEAFIVDVRSEDAYKAGHIRGAKLIPFSDVAKHMDELPKDKLIVTYCA